MGYITRKVSLQPSGQVTALLQRNAAPGGQALELHGHAQALHTAFCSCEQQGYWLLQRWSSIDATLTTQTSDYSTFQLATHNNSFANLILKSIKCGRPSDELTHPHMHKPKTQNLASSFYAHDVTVAASPSWKTKAADALKAQPAEGSMHSTISVISTKHQGGIGPPTCSVQ